MCPPHRAAPAVLLLVLALAGCGGSGSSPAPVLDPLAITVDAASVAGTLAPLWRDHYDLSVEHFDYASEPGFPALVAELAPRSLRVSVGRWEVGFPPPAGADSLDPAVLRTVEREFYRGPSTLSGADDAANYAFGYLDAQLAAVVGLGFEPYLCFDYMPFTLSAEKDPTNAWNFNLSQPGVPYAQLSFSNGIRTAPPADPDVYARVVRNVVRHVRGLFAGTTDFGVTYVEIGNEPDLIDALGDPLRVFWTGDRADWIATYVPIADAIDLDPDLTGTVRLGGGSFGYPAGEPAPTFLSDVLAFVAGTGTRLDFLSFHSYGDTLDEHVVRLLGLDILTSVLGFHPELVNAEWGRALDGLDPVYDTLEHGLFRTRVIAAMEAFGVTHAHEALLRNPGTQAGELGLLRTGPPAHKPVSRVYQALGFLDATPQALSVAAPPGTTVLAGRDAGGTRVVVAVVVEEPDPGHATRLELTLGGLPFGPAGFTLRRHLLDEARAAGAGLELLDMRDAVGPALIDTLRVDGAGLVVLELVAL